MFYNDNYNLANLAIIITLLIFSGYFISNEIRQIFREGLDYVLSVWNYSDLIGPAGVVFTCVLAILEYRGNTVQIQLMAIVQSITTLFMWIKLLYFMRIFRHTGYLIRMLIEVLSDMSTFLLVLLITLTAFGDAFLKMSLANEPENQFVLYSPTLIPDENGDVSASSGSMTVNTVEDANRRLFLFSIAYTFQGILGSFDTS